MTSVIYHARKPSANVTLHGYMYVAQLVLHIKYSLHMYSVHKVIRENRGNWRIKIASRDAPQISWSQTCYVKISHPVVLPMGIHCRDRFCSVCVSTLHGKPHPSILK